MARKMVRCTLDVMHDFEDDMDDDEIKSMVEVDFETLIDDGVTYDITVKSIEDDCP